MQRCYDFVVCDKTDCQKIHFKKLNWKDRKAIKTVMDGEGLVQTSFTCNYLFMCFERECKYCHAGLEFEKMKEIRKKAEKAMKERAKVEKEIIASSIKNSGKMMDWNDY